MTTSNPDSQHIPAPVSTTSQERPRVLSGMRPTGRLHLGNYMGALYNWVKLQHEYECYFFIADWHALTTDYADPSRLKQNVFDLALDFLAGGLDPDHCSIFVQSHVPQHAELNLLFSMFTPLSLLERVPTYKDQQEQLREKDLATYGFLGYPLLQSADILLYKPDFVPVGQDQEAHVELTREIVRRFNFLYPLAPYLRSIPLTRYTQDEFDEMHGSREDADAASPRGRSQTFRLGTSVEEYRGKNVIFDEPRVLLTPSPKLPGIDGRKMSKSYGNTILMTDPFSVVVQKIQSMSNGGQRPTQHDPGNPEICPVGDLHRIFSESFIDDRIRKDCLTASIRCDECKHLLGPAIGAKTHTMLNRRMELEHDPDRVWQILEQGTERAARRAEETMREIREVTGLSRDRSGVRIAKPRYGNGSDPNVRDLTHMKAWWGLEPSIFVRNLRELWRADIVPTETALKKDTEGVWLTRNSRRVFVAAAAESETAAAWNFSVKPKSYEIVVLLCWDKNFFMHDFVVPQKLYVSQWTKAKKAAGKENITFSVVLEEEHFSLYLPGSEAIDITATASDYAILGT